MRDSLSAQVYRFCKANYKPERFEMRNGPSWGLDYSKRVASGHMDSIVRYGNSIISMNESNTGKVIVFTEADIAE